MCISPITKWRKYATMSGRKTDIVPCGKCFQCLAKRKNDWSFRLYHQMQISSTACFMTLTYGLNKEEGYGCDPPFTHNGHYTLSKRHLQLFFKRLRKQSKTEIKYYAVGEYGTNFLRPHYHIIMFDLSSHLLYRSLGVSRNIWKKGNVDIAICNIATINYVVGYIMQGAWIPLDDSDDRQPHFSTMSKHLGSSYLTDEIYQYHLDRMETYVRHPGGFIISLPRYYREKIFSHEERMELEELRQQMFQYDWNDMVNKDYSLQLVNDNYQIDKANRKLKLERSVL